MSNIKSPLNLSVVKINQLFESSNFSSTSSTKHYPKNMFRHEYNLIKRDNKFDYDEYKSLLNDIEPLIIQKELQTEFGNINFMKDVSKIYQTITKLSKDINYRGMVMEYIDNLKKIGDASAYGDVYQADFEDAEHAMVIKLSKHAREMYDDLVHEAFIGFQLNNLRKYIANFSYTFDFFRCSPLFDLENHGYNLCIGDSNDSNDSNDLLPANNHVNYIIQEYVYPSKSLMNYIIKDQCTGDDFLNVFFQVMYALDKAHKMYDFTHYDLHSSNVMVRNLDKVYQLSYETENGVEYINTDILAMIIDFGMSHIKFEDKHYGVDMRKYHIYSNRSFIMQDVYKLLLSCARDAMVKNTAVYETIRQLYKFFSNEDIELVLRNNDKNNYFYYMPLSPTSEKATVYDFMQFVRQYINFATVEQDESIPMLIKNTDFSMEYLIGNACSQLSEFKEQVGAKYTHLVEKMNKYADIILYDRMSRDESNIQYILAYFNMVMLYIRAEYRYKNCPTTLELFEKNTDYILRTEEQIFDKINETPELYNNYDIQHFMNSLK
jgi:tRNA A-37 threonylcarbamoyl transferase component Bud32